VVDLNPLIHQPTRLRIMAALVSLGKREKADFSFLRDLLELTDGNLSVHIQRLEEAGYAMVEKTYVGRRPKTWIWATEDGRQAFEDHVDALELIVRRTRAG
jgi:DNA-binding MarR family transcriptional regulator